MHDTFLVKDNNESNDYLMVPKINNEYFDYYEVKKGDTLKELAKGLNTTIDLLVKQNDNIYLQPEQLIVYKYK